MRFFTSSKASHADSAIALDKASQGPEPGHVGNLTVDEQRNLQEAWVRLLRLCKADTNDTTNGISNGEVSGTADGIVNGVLDGASNGGAHGTANGTANGHAATSPVTTNGHHSYGHDSSKLSPADYRQLLWDQILADHPDATVLRFLRARKWDVNKAVAMLQSALDWRQEHDLNDSVVRPGDSIALRDPSSLSTDDKGFMSQYRSGKAYVRGADREGRPVFIIKVRLHDPKAQSEQSMERYVLHNIETMRSMVRHPNEKACLIFDLTGFGLKNMDFHVVKFLVQVFEARYPEYLGVVLVHNAPFIFWGVWKIIQPWLDPVIASKINFTSNNKDMAAYISPDQLQKSYGGEDDWEYKYVDPVAGENDHPEERRSVIEAERESLMRQFEDLTAEWAKMGPESSDAEEKMEERSKTAEKLAESFWKLDPYVRARTYYHRVGVVQPTGEIDFQAAK